MVECRGGEERFATGSTTETGLHRSSAATTKSCSDAASYPSRWRPRVRLGTSPFGKVPAALDQNGPRYGKSHVPRWPKYSTALKIDPTSIDATARARPLPGKHLPSHAPEMAMRATPNPKGHLDGNPGERRDAELVLA